MMDVAELTSIVRERLAAGKPVRRTLPNGGRLHIDRALPFLCVYTGTNRATSDLVRTHASYLIGQNVADLARNVIETLAASCGACLVVQVLDGTTDRFRIHTSITDRLATTIDTLATALRAMKLPIEVDVGVVPDSPVSLAKAGVLAIGLEVPASSRYPVVARALSRELTNALLRTFFEFARVQTPTSPEHFHALGRRRTVRAVHASDRALAAISESFDFLLAVTPVNAERAAHYVTKGCDEDPSNSPVGLCRDIKAAATKLHRYAVTVTDVQGLDGITKGTTCSLGVIPQDGSCRVRFACGERVLYGALGGQAPCKLTASGPVGGEAMTSAKDDDAAIDFNADAKTVRIHDEAKATAPAFDLRGTL